LATNNKVSETANYY